MKKTILSLLLLSCVAAHSEGYFLNTGSGGPTAWGTITGTLSNQTDLNSALTGKASTTLGNLGTTALNASLIPSTDNAISLGSATSRYVDAYFSNYIALGTFPLGGSHNSIIIDPTGGQLGNGNLPGIKLYSGGAQAYDMYADSSGFFFTNPGAGTTLAKISDGGLFSVLNTSNGAVKLSTDVNNNVMIGNAALATTATDGYLYIPTCAGTPTGTPTAKTGLAPMIYDTTNNKFWIYNGSAWNGINLL